MFVQIRDFPDYMVDENGVVVSLKYGKWKVLKPGKKREGYLFCILSDSDGKRTNKRINRLVAAAFLGESPLDVNHKNGSKTDNRLENLEYCSRSENVQHAYNLGLNETVRKSVSLANTGEKQHSAKLTDLDAARLLSLKGTMLQKEAASLFGVSQSQVSNIWIGKNRKHLHLENGG